MDQREDKESSDMMRLDPGPRRRTAASSTSFCCLITLLVGGLLALAIVAFLFSFILSNVRRIIYPHSSLLPNASLPEQGSLIRPLVNSGTTFDIVATVWVRAPRAEEREFNVLQAGGDEEAGRAYDSVLSADVKYLLEYPVFSDVVFRGLRMNDKHASTTVNFTFPTARFRDKDYTTGDLRASFVLIPSEPSVLGHLKNFSTIIPDELDDFPARPWPLPNATDGAPISSGHLGPRSLADAAIDAFGGFATLLEVHETASSCVPRNDEDREDAALDSKSVDDEITDLEGIAAKLEPYMHVYAQAHKKHPYVVTRTQLRIMIDENIYNLTAYNQEHKALKSVACGLKDKLPPGPSRNRCTRSFTQGPLRTRLEIAQPGEEESQWAYAPFLHPLRGSSGTLDLIPIPVDRENCTARNMVKANSSEALPFTDAENMTVTWRLSFSGRSAAKMAIADFIMPNLQFHPPHNASVASKKQAHELFELANGVFGHRFYEDAHPRRRLASLVVSTVAGYIAPLFNFHYWYTCSSTTGLSLRGQWLALTTDAFAELLQFTAAISDIGPDDWLVLALYLGLGIVAAIPVLVTSKALARIDGVRLRGWVPYLHRAKATHRERASARLDTQTTWSAVVAGSVILSLFYYVVKPWQLAALGSFDVPTSSEESKGLQI